MERAKRFDLGHWRRGYSTCAAGRAAGLAAIVPSASASCALGRSQPVVSRSSCSRNVAISREITSDLYGNMRSCSDDRSTGGEMAHPAYLRARARELRIKKHLSLDELAEHLALPKTTVYYWIKDLPLGRERRDSRASATGTSLCRRSTAGCVRRHTSKARRSTRADPGADLPRFRGALHRGGLQADRNTASASATPTRGWSRWRPAGSPALVEAACLRRPVPRRSGPRGAAHLLGRTARNRRSAYSDYSGSPTAGSSEVARGDLSTGS